MLCITQCIRVAFANIFVANISAPSFGSDLRNYSVAKILRHTVYNIDYTVWECLHASYTATHLINFMSTCDVDCSPLLTLVVLPHHLRQLVHQVVCEGQPLWPRPLICTGPTHSEGHLSQQVLAGDEGLTRELVDKELTKGKGAAWGVCINGASV